jgi:hypothetical protein
MRYSKPRKFQKLFEMLDAGPQDRNPGVIIVICIADTSEIGSLEKANIKEEEDSKQLQTCERVLTNSF